MKKIRILPLLLAFVIIIATSPSTTTSAVVQGCGSGFCAACFEAGGTDCVEGRECYCLGSAGWQ